MKEQDLVAKALQEIAATLPPLVPRTHPNFRTWTGVGPRRMANLDSAGEGPDERVLLGRAIAYPRESLVRWIAGRLKEAPVPHRRGVPNHLCPSAG